MKNKIISIQGNLIGRTAGGPCGIGVSDENVMYTLTKSDVHGVMQNGIVRNITPIEAERLQGFPDGWTEGASDKERHAQLGNAVTVNVIEWLAGNVKKFLMKEDV